MTDWTAGYVADIGYIFGAYSELNPLRVRLAFLHAGLALPESGVACELGFGQGMNINIHAAATFTEWHGTDFNPTQVGFAQDLAKVSGSKAKLHDESFEEFCKREDLPDFDFIALHGIWTWISNDNRGIIVDFVRRKLKVGGVLYVSYNTMQGWANMIPVRELMNGHSSVMAAPGKSMLPRVGESLDFIDRLFSTDPAYLKVNPSVKARVDSVKKMSRNYVAHEYFGRDWSPMSFSEMARWLAPAKLSFACSAHYPDQIDKINFTEEQLVLLKEIDDVHFAQTVRDFMLNQPFRRDYWVRGARTLRSSQRQELLMAQNVMLTVPLDKVQYKLRTVLGDVQLQESVYKPIIDFLSDYQSRTIGQIAEVCTAEDITNGQLIQAIFLLVAMEYVQAVQAPDFIVQAKPQTDKLNRYICQIAMDSYDISHLASPATGGAIHVPRFNQLFLLSRANGAQRPEQWAAFANGVLTRAGSRLVLKGTPVESEEEQLGELNRVAKEFAQRDMPILSALGVIF